MSYIHIEQLPALKRAYTKAVEKQNPEFSFCGKTLLTAYAKYLIEYFEGIKK